MRKINKSVESENEFDVFGQNVSLQLQKLPLEYALETQELIMKVLKEQRIKSLKEKAQQEALVISIPDDINLDLVDYIDTESKRDKPGPSDSSKEDLLGRAVCAMGSLESDDDD